jgi:hypothetical protein
LEKLAPWVEDKLWQRKSQTLERKRKSKEHGRSQTHQKAKRRELGAKGNHQKSEHQSKHQLIVIQASTVLEHPKYFGDVAQFCEKGNRCNPEGHTADILTPVFLQHATNPQA